MGPMGPMGPMDPVGLMGPMGPVDALAIGGLQKALFFTKKQARVVDGLI